MAERDDAGDRLIKIAVMGSCITRDNFNSRFNTDYKQAYEAVLMQNQSSLISLMSKPLQVPADQISVGSEYDRWNVRTDLSKEFLDQVAELAPDYLILDFFGDVHFGVLDLGDGRYITNNRWKLWPTPFYKQLQESEPPRWLRLDEDTEEYLALWRDAEHHPPASRAGPAGEPARGRGPRPAAGAPAAAGGRGPRGQGGHDPPAARAGS